MILGKMQVPAPAGTLKNGLLSCWEFNETSGATASDAKGNLNLTINSCTINQTGKQGKCYLYDAVDDWCSSISTSLYNSLTALTVSVWVYTDFSYSGSDLDSIVCCCGDYWYNTSKKFMLMTKYGSYQDFEFMVRDESGSNWASVRTAYYSRYSGHWYHVVCVWDASLNSSKPKIYQDAAEGSAYVNGQGTVADLGATNRILGIGGSADSDKYHNGKIDQVAIWNRALTDAEISQLYNSGNGKAYSTWS